MISKTITFCLVLYSSYTETRRMIYVNKLAQLMWTVSATVPDAGTELKNSLQIIINEIANTLINIRNPLMLAIVAVAAISLIWRVLSSDDPNELTRTLRTVLLVVGGAALVLYAGPAILTVIFGTGTGG